MSQLTMTGPYVNKTLFEQAKVPLPGPKATWDEWIDATRKVAKATQTPFAMALDRSGHRFAGPAISNGAKIFDAKGELMLDDGYKTTVTKFVDWNKDGTMPKEVWAGSGGSTYADSIDEFKNGRVVMVLSGSWQINRLQKDIGNAFDWVAVPNPCGPAACTGIPGGAALVALKTAKSPKEAGDVPRLHGAGSQLRRVRRQDQQHPGARGSRQEGRQLHRAPRRARARRSRRSAPASPKLAPVAYQFQGYKYNRAIMLPTVTARDAGDRRRDERRRGDDQDRRRHGRRGQAGAEIAGAAPARRAGDIGTT